MDTCAVCGGGEFYIESGYYYCQECQTQQENRREEAVEYIADPLVHIRKKKIKRIKSSSINSADKHGFGWTSWEAYNFILLGWTNELIQLGASSEIKITVLQLWTRYLNKLQVAFRSSTKKLLPRLPIAYREKDAEILYGNVNDDRGKTKKRKRRDSSVSATTGTNTSASEDESDHVSDLSTGRRTSMTKRALIDLEYKNYLDTTGSDTDVASTNPSLFSMQSDIQKSGKKKTIQLNFNNYAREEMKRRKAFHGNNDPMKVNKKLIQHLGLPGIQAILNLALRINDDNIYLSDILRFQQEGHMSTRHLEHFFPHDEPIPEDFIGIYRGNNYNSLHEHSFEMAQFLEVYEIPEPNLVALIERYCTELQLPQGIVLYAERMIALSPPNLTLKKRNKNLPLYEAKAISIILIVMKILFGLDGVTEYEISRVVDKINTIAEERNTMDCKLFNFIEWQRYIECRRTVVMSQHYPTKFRYDPTSPCQDVNVFLNYIKKFYKPGEYVDKSITTQAFTNVINQNMERLTENLPDIEERKMFEPSLTPMHSYLQELLKDSEMDLPNIVRQDFTSTKVGYLTNPQTYKNLAKECGIDLVILNSSAHFLHRIIPTHGIDEKPSEEIDIEEENELTQVVERQKDIRRSDDSLEYLHRKNTGKILIDKKKRQVYERIHQTKEQIDKDDYDDFSFDQVRHDGKLNVFDIYEESNSDNDDDKNVKSLKSFRSENMLLSNYEEQSMNVKLKNHWHIDDGIKTANFQWQMKRYLASKEQKEIYENCDCVICKTYVSPFDELDIEDKNDDFAAIENENDDLTILGEISTDHLNFKNDGISILSEKILEKNQANSVTKCENEITFSPYKDYWMNRINGELWKQNFDWHLFERDLPVNFRWLLHEFAKVIEIEPSLLYKEMACMEQYYSDCLVKNYNVERAKNFYDAFYHRDIRFTQAIRYKWNNITTAEEREEKLAKNPKSFSSWTRQKKTSKH